LIIVVLKMYFNDRGKIKLEIALGKGKRLWEKKQKIKEKDIKRLAERELKHYKS
jgi:SsrA-binding protein